MKKTSTRKEQLKGIALLTLAFVIPMVLIAVARMFFFGVYEIPSGSMEGTLNVGDKVVTLTQNSSYERNDIVVFSDDSKWTGMKGVFLIKRIIGVAGDTVSSDGIKVYVNGVPIEEDYVTGITSPFSEQKVPDGKIFVMGDNRGHSADSRAHIDTGTQFISVDSIVGKFWFKIF